MRNTSAGKSIVMVNTPKTVPPISDSACYRARLPSLYSDFRLQRTTNPDGYTANVSAWQAALAKAARAGLLPSRSDGSDLLILNTGQELLRALETEELGRPLALETVVVGKYQARTTIC